MGTFLLRPSLQSKHGLSSCFKGPHGSPSSEPTSVLDLATISPVSSPGTSPKHINPGMGAQPSLHKSIIHKSYYYSQNSNNSLHEDANMGEAFPQPINAYGDCWVPSSPSNSGSLATSTSIGGCASPNSCDGLSVEAQNEILQLLESLDDLEFETKAQMHTLEDVFAESAQPFITAAIEDEHNPWDEASFDLLPPIDVQDSLSCLEDTLSFKTEHYNIDGSPHNSLQKPLATMSHCLYPPLDRMERHDDDDDDDTNIHIHPLQRYENHVYDTNSSHTPTSGVQGVSFHSQFTVGCTEYTTDRHIRDSDTCGMLLPKAEECTSARDMQISTQCQEVQGLQLVHLLLLCAEMISERKYTVVHPLLRSLQIMSSTTGHPLERIASHFSEILLKRVEDLIPTTEDFNQSMHISAPTPAATHPMHARFEQVEIDAFYLAFYQALPYTKFLHFTANQAILEAVEDSSHIHVIDFDIQQGMQWPSFFQALAGRAQGPPESIKLSAIGSCMRRLNQTGRMLSEFAETLSLNFSFCPILVRDVRKLDVGMFATLARKRHGDVGGHGYEDLDEAIALNLPAILHSQIWEGVTRDTMLMLVKTIRPTVITIMKAEKHNEGPSFVHKFIEVLFYYSAFFDSLEVAMDRGSEERARIEKVFLSYGLKSIISETEEEELAMEASMERLQEVMNKAGFYSTQLSYHAIFQAKLLLRLYASEAFRIEGSQSTSALSINWKETPLFAVMAFSPAPLVQLF